MKKIGFIISLILVAISVTAQEITGSAIIKLATAGESDKELRFILSDDFSDGADETWDAEAGNAGGLYILYGGKRYSTWASDKYSKNLVMGFGTGSNNTYYLKFANNKFSGASFVILDKVTGTEITVDGTNNEDYEFTITDDQKNKAINDRFIINKGFDPDEGELEICFNEKGDNVLEIKNNPFDAQILIFKDGADTPIMTVDPVQTPQQIDLSSLDAGKYIVQMANGSRKFVIVKQ